MQRQFDSALVWVRERWLMVLLVAVIGAAIIVAIPAVLQLPQYPARQAAALRGRLPTADLTPAQRLGLEKDLLQYETDNRVKIWTAIVQGVGGAALLIGLLFTWRNLRATQLKLDIDRQGQITNRFTQATAQLGAQVGDGKPNVEARLGGIDALSSIARDSPDDYWPIVEIFTAYVRHNAAWPRGERETETAHATGTGRKPRSDIQAILTVLGRSTPPDASRRRLAEKIDLRLSDLRGAEFWDAQLENADFWGAHLEDAQMWGASLKNAKLVKAHLHRANLKFVNFAGADLTDAELDGADLTGANFTAATGLTRRQVDVSLNGGKGAVLPQQLAST